MNAAMSDICAAELDALSPFELELVARALQLRQPLTAAALSARLASLSAQQQSTRRSGWTAREIRLRRIRL